MNPGRVPPGWGAPNQPPSFPNGQQQQQARPFQQPSAPQHGYGANGGFRASAPPVAPWPRGPNNFDLTPAWNSPNTLPLLRQPRPRPQVPHAQSFQPAPNSATHNQHPNPFNRRGQNPGRLRLDSPHLPAQDPRPPLPPLGPGRNVVEHRSRLPPPAQSNSSTTLQTCQHKTRLPPPPLPTNPPHAPPPQPRRESRLPPPSRPTAECSAPKSKTALPAWASRSSPGLTVPTAKSLVAGTASGNGAAETETSTSTSRIARQRSRKSGGATPSPAIEAPEGDVARRESRDDAVEVDLSEAPPSLEGKGSLPSPRLEQRNPTREEDEDLESLGREISFILAGENNVVDDDGDSSMLDNLVSPADDQRPDSMLSPSVITRLPAPGDTFSSEAAFFAACHDGVPKELGFSMYKHYYTKKVLVSSCSKRNPIGCPFRIHALCAPTGVWIVSAERSCWTHDHRGKDEREDNLSESEEESSQVGDDVVGTFAHHAPSQSNLSSIQLPVPGDTFGSPKSFYTACREGLRNAMGIGMSCTNTTLSTVTSTCNRRTRHGCRFLIRAVIDSRGRWVVSDERSRWTHNHDAITSAGEAPDASKSHARFPYEEQASDSEEQPPPSKRARLTINPQPRVVQPPLGPAANSSSQPEQSSSHSNGSTDLPLSTFIDSPLSTADLSKLLTTLSPLLGSIARELHGLGIDSHLRFTNLVLAPETLSINFFEELEERGVSPLHRNLLSNKLEVLRKDFGASGK